MPRKKSNEPRKTTKGKGRNFRTVKEGAGMTKKGVAAYRKKNPGSKLKTAVTGKVKKGSKAAKRKKAGQAQEVKQLEKDGSVNMKSRGLGDSVHKFTKATGIKKMVDTVSRGLNIPCGCEGRRDAMNMMFPYRKK